MKNCGGYELKDPKKIAELADLVMQPWKEGAHERSPKVNFVGKSAKYILGELGIQVGDDVKVIFLDGVEPGSKIR